MKRYLHRQNLELLADEMNKKVAEFGLSFVDYSGVDIPPDRPQPARLGIVDVIKYFLKVL